MRERSGVAHDRAVMPLRVGFADTLSGQLHFRACGAGPDLVLLPWAPASGRMYDIIMPHLARSGFRAIAFDLAGTGRSHKNCRNWTVQQYAADILEACGSLHTVPYTVIGGRFGASVAVEMLLAAPAQVTGAVLDGVLGLAPEELRKVTTLTAGLSPKLASDGAHAASPSRLPCACSRTGIRASSSRRRRSRWCTKTCVTILELGYEAIVAGVEADARGGRGGSRRAGAARRGFATRAGHDFGYRSAGVRLQPGAGEGAQFPRPQVRRQPSGAHAVARCRVRAARGFIRATLKLQ